MEKKKIEDYLHLYLGHKCKDDQGNVARLSGIDLCQSDNSIVMLTTRRSDDIDDFNVYNDDERMDRLKPILRQLSDMTDEECLNSANVLGGADHLSDDSKIVQMRDLICTNRLYTAQTNIAGHKWMNLTVYLLKQGFDLFGLIDADLAIAKTTINAKK